MNGTIDVTNIHLETQRLILRPWELTDLEDLYEYAKVEGVGEMAGWVHHESRDVTKAVLTSFIEKKKTFALVDKETGKVIGSLGLEQLHPDPVEGQFFGREIGYVLSKDYWGRGLMPEAVKAVIDYCFRVLKLDYLTCGHFERNNQSRRVIEKSGFVYFGDSTHETRYDTIETTKKYIIYNPEREVNHV